MINWIRPFRFVPFLGTIALTGTGTIALAGTATVSLKTDINLSGTGAIAMAGSATATVTDTDFSLTGTGTIALSGSATATVVNTDFALTGTGAIVLAGTGTLTTDIAATGTGAIALAGTGTVTVVTAVPPRSLTFDGANEYLHMTDANASSGGIEFDYDEAFSIALWVKFDDLDNVAFWTKKTTVGSTGIMIDAINSGKPRFIITGSNGSYTIIQTSSAHSTGTWYHYVFTKSTGAADSDMTIYLDGSAASTSTVSAGPVTASMGNTDDLRIGGNYLSTPTSLMDGKMYQVAAFDKELTSGEVSTLYNSGAGKSYAQAASDSYYGNTLLWLDFGDDSDLGNDSSGTQVDFSQANMDSGNQSTDVPAAPVSNVRSLTFDGASDYATTTFDPTTIGAGEFTVSAWIKWDSFAGNGMQWFIGGHNTSTNPENFIALQVLTSGTVLRVQGRLDDSGPTIFNTTASLSTGTWYHVVLTRQGTGSGATVKVYVDGGTPEESSAHEDWGNDLTRHSVSNTEDFRLAKYFNANFYHNGHLDEVAIWDVALDADAVTAIYNSGAPTDLSADRGDYDNSGDLQAWWRLDETSGTSLADSSTNSNTGTNEGATIDTDVPA